MGSQSWSAVVITSYDPETGSHPDDDIDQIPLSFFMEQQRHKDIVWEWFLDAIKTCTKVLVPCVTINPPSADKYIIGVLPWGYCILGVWSTATDLLQWYAWSGLGPNIASWSTSLLHTEIQDSGLPESADGATWLANLDAMLKKYYSFGMRIAKFGYYDPAVYNNLYEHYDAFQGIIWEAARFAGILDRKERKSFASLFNAEKYVKDWLAEKEEEDNSAWSEAMWPELPGYNTQYIDNIGIFVPMGYIIDQYFNYLIMALIPEVPAYIRNNVVVLKLAQPWDTAQVYQGYQTDTYLTSNVPYLGSIASAMRDLGKYNMTQKNIFWPRIFAFGRGAGRRIPGPDQIRQIQDAYDYFKRTNKVPGFASPPIAQITDLLRTLVGKGYIEYQDASGWL